MSKQLRVWHLRNMQSEQIPVSSIAEAVETLDRLAQDDLKNPDVSFNAQGLSEYDPDTGEWYEWHDDYSDSILVYTFDGEYAGELPDSN